MNLMINQRIIKKIQALAEDERGDPKTRAIAQRKLAEFKLGDPRNPPPNPPNPRTQHSAEYTKFRFMNFDTWSRTSSGQRATTLNVNGVPYHVVIFILIPHKETPIWSWFRHVIHPNGIGRIHEVYSDGKFATIDEARRDAWDKLMTL